MIAPAAFENITFPQQALFPWSSFESLQYMRACESYFSSGSGNGVAYGAAVEIGPDYGASVAKWNGGAMTPGGVIYAPGYLQNTWLLVDTNNDSVTTTGSLGTSPSSPGAFYSPYNRAVYAWSAANSGRMQKITIDNNSGSSTAFTGSANAAPFVLAYDGLNAYNTGIASVRSMMKYDIIAETGSNLGIATTNDRYNGCLGPNGKIYWSPAGPAGTRNYIEFDPATSTYTSFGTPGGDTQQAIILAPDGFMYVLPFGANAVNRINPATRAVTAMVTAAAGTVCATACIGADGNIWSVGVGNRITCYNWRTNSLFTPGNMPSTGGYQGLVMGVNGDLYAIPWTAPRVVKIPIINNGRVTRPIQEMNGILGRHQTAV